MLSRTLFRAIENITYASERKRKQLLSLVFSQRRCKATVINGTKIAKEIQEGIAQEVTLLRKKNFNPPHLTTIIVGDDYASHLYVKRKLIAAKLVGISTNAIFLDKSVSERDLLNLIESLNDNEDVNAVLVQLPLPKHISERRISNSINSNKDVDGFNYKNIGHFCLNEMSVIPCTALAVREILRHTGIDTKGKHAVVCGRSKNVGMPIGMILQSDGQGETFGLDTTTTICHRFTPHDKLSKLARSADLLISAAGVPNLITSDMVKEGACVIDVGISRHIDPFSGKSCIRGDVDFDGVKEVAAYITPVPGGVGPLTVSMLLRNTLSVAKQQYIMASSS